MELQSSDGASIFDWIDRIELRLEVFDLRLDGASTRENDSCRAEIGYVLGSNYWGRGIVTQAVKMAARSVFVEWPHLERLEALVDVENKGSQRVLEKSGFQREGVLRKYYLQKGRARDTVVFSLLSTDPLINSFMYS